MRHRESLLLLCGVAAAVLTALAGMAGGSRPVALLAPWLAAHAAYATAAWLIVARGARARLWLLIALGLLPRLALLPAEPRLSEDVFRYLWDGRLVADGVNPFPRAPNDPALARYHDRLLARLNHADVPTIYPPLAQILFAAAARAAPEPWAWKTLLLLLDALLLVALASIVQARSLPLERLALYWWNPLVIVESFGSGHLDLAAGAFLIFALAWFERRRAWGGGISLGAAAAIKYMPLLLLPALVRRRSVAALAGTAAAMALLFAPFLSAGPALWAGLATYLRHWEFNGSLYPLIRPLFASGETPRAILAGLVGVASIAVGWRARTLSGAALLLLAVWIAASPTVYPWYVVMLVALLPLHPDAGIIAFSGLVALSYAPLGAYRAGGAWTLPPWIPWVEYGGWALAALAAALAARRYPRSAAWRSDITPT